MGLGLNVSGSVKQQRKCAGDFECRDTMSGPLRGKPTVKGFSPLCGLGIESHRIAGPLSGTFDSDQIDGVYKSMTAWRAQGRALRDIATGLNRLNIRPPRGRQWYASSVRNQLP